MQLKDVAAYKEVYEKTSAQSKSYYVSLWFLLLTSLFHIVLDLRTTLDITLAYKWTALAVLTLIGVLTYRKQKVREINMHAIFAFLTMVFIPYAFVTSGGQYSFVQYFMIVYLVLIFFMMELKYAAIYAIYNFVQLELLYILERQRPDIIKPLAIEWLVIENAITIPILMVIMVALVTILLVLYKSDEEKVKKSNSKLTRDAKLKDTMLKITYSVTKNYDREKITETILDRLIDAMDNADQGSILRIDKRKAHYDSAIGFDVNALKDIVVPVQETYLYKATDGLMDKAVIISNDQRVALDKKNGNISQNRFFYNRSTLTSPIMLYGKIWGILNIESVEGFEFKQKDKEFIRLFTNEIEKVLSFSLLLEQNHKLRSYDYLTGIMNRMKFAEVMEVSLAKLGKQDKMSLITCDLDNFKLINDQYGHGYGDDYLKYFVSIVSRNLSDEDCFGRTGGDEFQILMPSKTPSEANLVMQKIQNEFFKRPVVIKRNRIVLRFSYGIVSCDKGRTVEDVTRRADEMMYENKKINKLNSFKKEWTFNI